MEIREYSVRAVDSVPLTIRVAKPERAVKGVLCLVHGQGDYGGCFGRLFEFFIAESFGVTAIDLHGNGSSGGVRGHAESLEVLYDDIGLLLEQAGEQFPGAPLFLYGHSLGGNLVLNYALLRKPSVTGVIASSPWLELAEHPRLKRALAGFLGAVRPNLILDTGIDAAKLSHNPEFVRTYALDPLVHGKISVRLLAASCASGRRAIRSAAKWEVPLLLMHGGADRITSAEATRRFFEAVPAGKAELKIWQGLFHSLHNEQNSGEIFRFVLEFLNSSQSGADALRVADSSNLEV